MSPFSLSLTVQRPDRAVRVRVRLARPATWSAVRSAICRAAGLPESTVLYRGIGPVEPEWIVGAPPLVTGCLLALVPDDDPPTSHLLLAAVVAGPDAGRTIALGNDDRTVGRDPAVDLSLTDPASSWHHVMLCPAATGITVHDLRSTNGTRVDGQAVAAESRATTGSVIRLGNTVLQLQLAAERGGAFRPDGHGTATRTGRAPDRPPAPAPIPARPRPPSAPERRALPLMSAAVGVAVGAGLAIALHHPMYLAFAALGPLTMVSGAVTDRLRGRRSLRRQRRDYRLARAEWEHRVAQLTDSARRAAWHHWPGPAELLRRAEVGSARLWSRVPRPEIAVSIGCGPRYLPVAAADRSTACSADASETGEDPAGVPLIDAPWPIPLHGAVGLVGARGRGSARYLLAQLACFYSPADLALVVIAAGSDLGGCADLPHTVPVTPETTYDEVRRTASGRRLVAVLDGAEVAQSALGTAFLADAAIGASPDGPLLLCLAPSATLLPSCAAALPVSAVATGRSTEVAITEVSASDFGRLCRALAPLRDGVLAHSPLPRAVDLASLIGPIDENGVRRRWRTPSAVAVLGALPDGVATLDLDADGPHLLIAGTTGAGKSELLTTLIASLAVAGSPRDVTFLLVDYKGGSAFNAIRALPHVVGVLTDLDPAASARALSGLRAELRRRERLEAAGGAPEAKLVIVIDEFATLAAELPEFLVGVIDIAQRGRSLGLHLVLATQRPAGVVSPAMRANISARICLRVTDPADSVDVVGTPAAAGFPVDRPGQAILLVGGRRCEFQTARVTVPPPDDILAWPEDSPPSCDTNPSAGAPASGAGPATILAELVEATRAAARDQPAPPLPWLPPLPSRVAAPPGAPMFGFADRPESQRQDFVPPPNGSALVLGPPGSGRTTALRRLAATAADAGDEIIVIDGADGLRDLATWPEVSSHLTLSEPRLVLRLLTLLADPARRPRSGQVRHVVIDHLDVVIAELERVDYVVGAASLIELAARAAGTVRISAAGPLRLEHHRIASSFTDVIALTGDTPGRARWSGVTLQVVEDPPDRRRPSTPRPASAVADPHGDRIAVRPLPISVRLDELPPPQPRSVTVGVGGDAALPYGIDLTGAGGAIVVAGPRRSGVSNAMSVLTQQAAACGIPTILVVGGSPDGGSPSDATTANLRTVTCLDGADALVAALRDHDGPLLLAADLGNLGEDHPAAAVFDRFLAVCGAGQHLAVGARIQAVSRARRGYLQAATSHRRALLLSPEPSDGALFDVSVPRRSGPVVPGRGLWVDGGVGVPVHLARLAHDGAPPL